jgi:E3 ubiquitin-protein ligase NEDD4
VRDGANIRVTDSNKADFIKKKSRYVGYLGVEN